MPTLYLEPESLYTSTEIDFPFNINVDYNISAVFDTSTSIDTFDLGVYIYLMEFGESLDTSTTIDPFNISLEIGLVETVETYTDIDPLNLSVDYSISEIINTSTEIDLLLSIPLSLTFNYHPPLPPGYNYMPPHLIPVGVSRTNVPLEFNTSTEINNFELTTNFFRFLSPTRIFSATHAVINPDLKLGALDTFFRILELYRSMSNIDDVLENVRDAAELELLSYGIYENQIDPNGQFIEPIFYDDASVIDLQTRKVKIPVGTRGYVAQGFDENTGERNARETFYGKDGQFCVYVGGVRE